jgi:chloride channel protein, CIC family
VSRRKLEFGYPEIVIGVSAGVAGASTTLLLHAIEHLTCRYSFGSLLQGVTGSSRVSRAVGPMIGGMLAGCGWRLVRRRTTLLSLSDTAARHERIPRLAMTLDAGLQVLLAAPA